MTSIAVVTSSSSTAHSRMAAEAIKRTAALMGHAVRVEVQDAAGISEILTVADLNAADLVILASDMPLEKTRFSGKPVHETKTSIAILETRSVIEAAVSSIGVAARIQVAEAHPGRSLRKKVVAVTACPTGIAHTFMAAEALQKAAARSGCEIRVETQGSVGAKSRLTHDEISAADIVVIGADTHVDKSRFTGKPVFETSVGRALKEPDKVLQEAFASISTKEEPKVEAHDSVSAETGNTRRRPGGPYRHLLTGVSYMLPIVVAGGLSIALSFIFGIDAYQSKGSLASHLMEMGSGAAFSLMIPVLAGFIAVSIADRPGIAPGLIGGMLANQLQTGFLGGIAAGFLAGYVALFLRSKIKLPVYLEGLKPVLILPLLSTLAVGLLMIYAVGAPARAIMDGLSRFLQQMSGTNAFLVGLLLGGLMALDMGGPINKAAYTIGVGLLASQNFMPMAAVMAGGMVPPLGIALATLLAKNRFTREEQTAGKAAAVLGISFITEGAIPFAARDPFRVIPACVAGSAIAGALSMASGVTLRAPHGGIFVLAIPNAVGRLLPYIGAIAAGAAVTAALLIVLKKPETATD